MRDLLILAATDAHAEAEGGLSVLGIDLQGFLFQLITFSLVLLILAKFAYKPLLKTLEDRRQTVLDSLDDAKKTAEQLTATNKQTEAMLAEAREQAEAIVATAHKEAAAMVEEADAKATKRAEHIIETAESRLANDVERARNQLRQETLELVAMATEKIIGQKLDKKRDSQLIKDALEVKR